MTLTTTLKNMVGAMEIVPNYITPTLSPLSGIAPLVHAPCVGNGKNWLLTSTGIAIAAAATPQS